jgi:hypothetical protein
VEVIGGNARLLAGRKQLALSVSMPFVRELKRIEMHPQAPRSTKILLHPKRIIRRQM